MILAIYNIIVSIRGLFKYMNKIYVSYITDIGHRNNYFYMQILQGSCVANKQLLQTVAPKRAEFLDYCHSVRQTFHKKELTVTSITNLWFINAYSPPSPELRMNGPLIDRSRMHSSMVIIHAFIIIIIIIKICSAHISTLLGAQGAETEKT